MKSEPYVQIILDAVAKRGWAIQGKQAMAFMVERNLSACTLFRWKTHKATPLLETWLTVLDGLGYRIEVVPK